MQFYLISDNVDTQVGMRLAGIPGEVVHEPEEVRLALRKAMDNPKVGVVLITQKLRDKMHEELDQIKLTRPFPLIVEIHGGEAVSGALLGYVQEAIGVRF